MRRLLLWVVVLYLRFWAHVALFLNKVQVIGIAGSVGKSSARNILSSMLQENTRVANIFGNSETGIPLGILGIKPRGYNALSWLLMLIRAPFGIFYIRGKKWLIIEMGIDEPYPPRNMEYLLSIVKPDIGVSLNVSATHTQQFEQLMHEKQYKHIKDADRQEFLLSKIAEDDVGIITRSGCNTGIYNKDDAYIASEIEKFCTKKSDTRLLTFGKDDADAFCTRHDITLEKTEFELAVDEETHMLALLGYILPREYGDVIAACILAAREAGVDTADALSSLEKHFSLPAGRASVFSGINDAIILDSSYNASKSATIAFLRMATELKVKTGREVAFLFGDMRELGEEAAREHREVAKVITETVDYLYCVGPLTKQYVLPIAEKKKNIKVVEWFGNSREAGDYLQSNLPKSSILLVKGSQNTIFLEESVKMLLKNKQDVSKLCRQEGYWGEIKRSVL